MIGGRRKRIGSWSPWLALAAIPGATAAGAQSSLTAADLCAPGVNPCVIRRASAVPDGTVLDFGARDVVVTGTGALDVGSGTLRVFARSLDVQPRGGLFAAGGLLAVTTTGDLTLERSVDGKTRARLVVAADAGGGEIDLAAGGTLTVAGSLNARGTSPNADGGTLKLVAGGDVVLSAAAGDVTVAAGLQGAGGQVSLVSLGGGVVVQHGLDASGGDDNGGDVAISAARDVSLDQIDVRGGGSSGDGGSVTVSAGGDVFVNGPLLGAAASGANGAEVGVAAGGTLHVAAPIRVPGGAPDGNGGDVGLTGAVVELQAPVATTGGGTEGDGGNVWVAATGDVAMAALIDASGGSDARGGTVSLSAPGSITIDGEIAADGDVGEIDVTSGSVLIATGVLHASAAPDGLGGTVNLQGACDLRLGPDAQVTTAGSDGDNLLAGGRPMRIAGTITATARNVLEYGDPAFPPVVTGELLPAPIETMAATLPACGAGVTSTTVPPSTTTTTTSTTSSSTVVATAPASTSSSTTSTVSPSSSSTSTAEPAPSTSESSTAISSTSSSTSSTTLAPASCGPLDACDDGVECTHDRCVDGECVHDEAPGRAGVLCRIMELETMLEAPPPGALAPGVLGRRLVRLATRAVRLVGAAGARTGSRDRLRRAARRLTTLEHLVRRHEGSTIATDFAEHLRALVSGATVRLTVLIDARPA